MGGYRLLGFLIVKSTWTPDLRFACLRPFHAAMGIMTTRMLMHVRKLAAQTDAFAELSGEESSGEHGEFDGNLPRFVDPAPLSVTCGEV